MMQVGCIGFEMSELELKLMRAALECTLGKSAQVIRSNDFQALAIKKTDLFFGKPRSHVDVQISQWGLFWKSILVPFKTAHSIFLSISVLECSVCVCRAKQDSSNSSYFGRYDAKSQGALSLFCLKLLSTTLTWYLVLL